MKEVKESKETQLGGLSELLEYAAGESQSLGLGRLHILLRDAVLAVTDELAALEAATTKRNAMSTIVPLRRGTTLERSWNIMASAPPETTASRRDLTELTRDEILTQAREYRAMAATSSTEDVAHSLNELASRLEAMAESRQGAEREGERTRRGGETNGRSGPELS